MFTLLTLPELTVPDALLTAQLCVGFEGCVSTVTAYGVPLATLKVKFVEPGGRVRLPAPLFCSTRPVPASPVMVPPTVKVEVTQVTCTLVTSTTATVPVALATVHTWAGFVGWLPTVMAYAAPLAS